MIRFKCACGKSLKAPAKLAGKSSRCPACGAAVVVPQIGPEPTLAVSSAEASASLRPVPAAVTFREWPADSDRVPEDASNVYALAAAPPTAWVANVAPTVDPNYVPPAAYKRHPFEVWLDPLAGMKFVIQISGILAVLTALGVALCPHVLREGTAWLNGLLLAAIWAGATALCLGYGCGYLEAMLEYALSGGKKDVHVPNYDPAPAMTSFAKWSLCFSCGPAFLFYLAFHYWIHCGDMTPLDALILAELAAPAVTWWLMQQLVLATRPERGHVSPAQVLTATRRLGLRALLAGLAATAAGYIHLCLAAGAIMLLHESLLPGLILLWLCWFSVWQTSAFALRRLAGWQHQFCGSPVM